MQIAIEVCFATMDTVAIADSTLNVLKDIFVEDMDALRNNVTED